MKPSISSVFRVLLCSTIILATAAGLCSAQTFPVSGGGTNVISGIIDSATPTGGTIIINDSATYTETQNLVVGQRNSAVHGRRSFNIEAAAGQNPTIVLNNSGIIMYSGSADFHFGSATGGRIKIDATNANTGVGNVIWYIGQENDATGTACQALFENLDFDFTSRVECIVFGAGGNDASPVTTGASMTFRDVTTTGGSYVFRQLYGPITYASQLNIENCRILDFVNFIGVEVGAYGLGGADSVCNITRTIIYNSPSSGAADSNSIVGRLGQININHCDIINEATPGTSRAVTLVDAGVCDIKDSIIRGDAGTINFGTWTATVEDSNVSSTAVDNVGFTYTNVINEWPVYDVYGSNFTNPDNFKVLAGTLSAAHGTTPPLGSVGILTDVSEWTQY